MYRDVARVFTVAFFLLWGLAAACNRADPPDEEAQSGSVKVRCAPVEEGTAVDTVELRGTVAPPQERDAMVASQIEGRLLAVTVQEGDAVKAGQIVARVDASAIKDQAAQADAVLERARAERRNAKSTLARTERVFEKGIAARQEVDDAAAREAGAEAGEAEAAALASQARRQIGRTKVRSPMTGIVLKVLRKPGELVDGTPATPIVEIADTSILELAADAPTQDLIRLTRGATAEISFAAIPGRTLKGTVTRVAPSVDRSTGLGAVHVTLDDPDVPKLPVGAFGTARVSSGVPRPAIFVPSVAVRSATGGASEIVICGKDRKAHVVTIEPGSVRDGRVEVQGALGDADRVCVAPVIGLSDGQDIEVEQ